MKYRKYKVMLKYLIFTIMENFRENIQTFSSSQDYPCIYITARKFEEIVHDDDRLSKNKEF